jgi:hypothetical protein
LNWPSRGQQQLKINLDESIHVWNQMTMHLYGSLKEREMHQSIGQAAFLLGISITTLRPWEREGFFVPTYRTLGGHRRYAFSALENLFHQNKSQDQALESPKALGYARV